MRIDLYTKSILTLIAACLVCLCLKNTDTLPRAFGDANSVQDVRIVAIQKPTNANGTTAGNWDTINVWNNNR